MRQAPSSTNKQPRRIVKDKKEQQLLDLIFTIGEYNLVSMALNSCGIQRDPGVPGFPEGAGK